jgi:hypothetical protein
MRDKTAIILAIGSGAIGVICYFVRLYEFAWGNVTIMANGATVNDVWYYWFESFSYACFMAALAFITCHIAEIEKTTDSATLKYATIFSSFIFAIRAVCNIFTYNIVTDFEAALYLISFIYTCYRAVLWHNSNLKSNGTTTRHTLENN